jgi:putative transposase
VPLAQLAREHGIQLRRLQRWVRAYRQEGLDGLALHTRADRGQRRRVSPELQQVIEGLALRRPPLSRAAVHRETVALARTRLA